MVWGKGGMMRETGGVVREVFVAVMETWGRRDWQQAVVKGN